MRMVPVLHGRASPPQVALLGGKQCAAVSSTLGEIAAALQLKLLGSFSLLIATV
jgi:hypothetical protein